MRRNEKMKMKKVMAAMLAGMMLVSMAGCGTGAQGGSDGAGTDSAQTQESTDGKSTLTIPPNTRRIPPRPAQPERRHRR